MNFARMHELEARYSYPVAAVLTLVSIGGMVLFMRKRRWL